ncbi:hypothetical protein K525DRAFT_249301 [Schizophyllum commune Loenen D]|nr:hypothetical protein K525DRAFT_249301 [Schizophyllum commune Loenen D]
MSRDTGFQHMSGSVRWHWPQMRIWLSSSPLVQIIAFDLAVVLLSFSCIYIVLHAAYAILEQTVLGESRKPREEKMGELDEIFKKYKYSIPEDEMDEFQKDFANFARRRGYLMNGSLLPGGQSAEDDLAIAPLASVDGDVPLAAKTPRVVETPERPITPPPLPMFAAVISPGASSFVSLTHTSLAGNLTKTPVRIQPLLGKAYTPAHTLEAIATQEGVSESLTSRVALPGSSLGGQSTAATINGTYELGSGLVPGETLIGTTIPPPIPPLRQPSFSAGPADEFSSNAPLLRNDPLLIEGDALFGDVAPLAKAVTPVDDVAEPLAEGQLSAPFVVEGFVEEQQIFIPPNASLTRMSPTADPTRDVGFEQALDLPPMADSTLSLPADSTASQKANGTASRRRAGSIATRPASGAASSRSAPGTAIAAPPANPSSISIQELFLGYFGTGASEEDSEEHGRRVNALVAQVNGEAAQPGASAGQNNDSAVQAGASAGQANDSTAEGGTTYSQDGAPSTELDVYAAPDPSAFANSEGDATAGPEDDRSAAPRLYASPSASPSSATSVIDEPSSEDVDGEERKNPLQEPGGDSSHTTWVDPAPSASIRAEREIAMEEGSTDHTPDNHTGHSPEDPIFVSPGGDNSISIDEGDITLSPDDDAHLSGTAQEDASSLPTDGRSVLPADGRSVLPVNGPRSAFDDSDEEEDEDEGEEEEQDGSDEEEEEEEEEDIVDASTLHNGTLSPIAEGVNEDEEGDSVHPDEEVSPAHHERVEPSVSYAAVVRGEGQDNAVWWTK